MADAEAGLSTFFIALVLFNRQLEVWHIYLSATASSSCGTFQWPAYTATVFVLMGPSKIVISVSAYFNPGVRLVEDKLSAMPADNNG